MSPAEAFGVGVGVGVFVGAGGIVGLIWWAKRKVLSRLAPAGKASPPPFNLKPVKGGRL